MASASSPGGSLCALRDPAVGMPPGAIQDPHELLADLRRGFSTLPGTNVTIGQPISHRIDHMLSGTRANIARG